MRPILKHDRSGRPIDRGPEQGRRRLLGSGLLRGRGRAVRGGILVEYSIVSLVGLMIIFGTLEWGVQMFVRQSVEATAEAAAENFALSRDPDQAQVAAEKVSAGLLRVCLDPIEFHLFEAVSGRDLLAGGSAAGATPDPNAVLARVDVRCHWASLFPALWQKPGAGMTHAATAYVRLR